MACMNWIWAAGAPRCGFAAPHPAPPAGRPTRGPAGGDTFRKAGSPAPSNNAIRLRDSQAPMQRGCWRLLSTCCTVGAPARCRRPLLQPSLWLFTIIIHDSGAYADCHDTAGKEAALVPPDTSGPPYLRRGRGPSAQPCVGPSQTSSLSCCARLASKRSRTLRRLRAGPGAASSCPRLASLPPRLLRADAHLGALHQRVLRLDHPRNGLRRQQDPFADDSFR